jgi:archaellum biogenesis ATPase FlaH
MSDKLPSTFFNQTAEIAVVCSILKHHQFFPEFEALSVNDFTQGVFRDVFARTRELHDAGTYITTATVGIDVATEEWAITYGQDWEEEFQGLVKVIKECSRRRRMVNALGLDIEKSEGMSTPALALEFSKKSKEYEAQAKEAQTYVDEYMGAATAKKTIEWKTLDTEDEIINQQGTSIVYVVDEIIPKNRVTMLFGQEKTGKSIIALDICKHVANGKQWLNRATVRTPCLYIDLEDGILGSYIGWVQKVGEEKIRFITLRTKDGIPNLDDPGLLAMCAEVQPLVVLDSLHKFFSREKPGKYGSAWQSDQYEPVLEKVRQLCVAGATVLVIHHATKADEEQYRDSSAIGANVDFIFAVTAEKQDSNGVKRVQMIGKPSRGAQPPTIHILAFPHIIQSGHLCLDAGLEDEENAAWLAALEVKPPNPPAKNKTQLAKRLSGKESSKYPAIDLAIQKGWIVKGPNGEMCFGKGPGSAPEVELSEASGSIFGSADDHEQF